MKKFWGVLLALAALCVAFAAPAMAAATVTISADKVTSPDVSAGVALTGTSYDVEISQDVLFLVSVSDDSVTVTSAEVSPASFDVVTANKTVSFDVKSTDVTTSGATVTVKLSDNSLYTFKISAEENTTSFGAFTSATLVLTSGDSTYTATINADEVVGYDDDGEETDFTWATELASFDVEEDEDAGTAPAGIYDGISFVDADENEPDAIVPGATLSADGNVYGVYFLAAETEDEDEDSDSDEDEDTEDEEASFTEVSANFPITLAAGTYRVVFASGDTYMAVQFDVESSEDEDTATFEDFVLKVGDNEWIVSTSEDITPITQPADADELATITSQDEGVYTDSNEFEIASSDKGAVTFSVESEADFEVAVYSATASDDAYVYEFLKSGDMTVEVTGSATEKAEYRLVVTQTSPDIDPNSFIADVVISPDVASDEPAPGPEPGPEPEPVGPNSDVAEVDTTLTEATDLTTTSVGTATLPSNLGSVLSDLAELPKSSITVDSGTLASTVAFAPAGVTNGMGFNVWMLDAVKVNGGSDTFANSAAGAFDNYKTSSDGIRYYGPFKAVVSDGQIKVSVDSLRYTDGTKGYVPSASTVFYGRNTGTDSIGSVNVASDEGDVVFKTPTIATAATSTTKPAATRNTDSSSGCNAGLGAAALLLAGLLPLRRGRR